VNKGAIFKILFIFLFVLSLALNAVLIIKLREIKGEIANIVSPSEFKLLSFNSNAPLDAEGQSSEVILYFDPLKEKIEKETSYIAGEEKFGFYLQSLYSGAWLGINEREGFLPASLLKVPVAMAIFKRVENEELELDQKIAITEDDIDYSSGIPGRLKSGDQESVWELLEIMINASDNTAKNALLRYLDVEDVGMLFSHIGIENPYLTQIKDALVTPRQFSRIFKALYFSTYLSPKNSEKLLELTTETREEGLISAGLPTEIQVAHKYGESESVLHDCGIVYLPGNHYFLCIMTSGLEKEVARNLLKGISQEVYNFFIAVDK